MCIVQVQLKVEKTTTNYFIQMIEVQIMKWMAINAHIFRFQSSSITQANALEIKFFFSNEKREKKELNAFAKWFEK